MADGIISIFTANPYGAALAVILLSVGAGVVMNFIVIRYLRTYTDQTPTDYDSIVVNNLHIPLHDSLVGGLFGTCEYSVSNGEYVSHASTDIDIRG